VSLLCEPLHRSTGAGKKMGCAKKASITKRKRKSRIDLRGGHKKESALENKWCLTGGGAVKGKGKKGIRRAV